MIETAYVDTPDPCEAERNLWAAVMLGAFESFDTGTPKQKREAKEWFLSRNQGVGSFIFVCAVLGIPPLDARRRLDSWTQETS